MGVDRVGQQVHVRAPQVHLPVHDDDGVRDPGLPGLLVQAGEDDDVQGPVHVLQRDEGHAVPRFGVDLLHTVDEPAGANPTADVTLVQQARVLGDVIPQVDVQFLQGMGGDVDAEEFLLPAQEFALGGKFDVGEHDLRAGVFLLFPQEVENGDLARVPVFVVVGAVGHDGVQRGEDAGPVAEGVERPHPDEALQGLLVDLAQIDPAGEVLEGGEGAPGRAGPEDDFHGPHTDVLHRGQAESNGRTGRYGKGVSGLLFQLPPLGRVLGKLFDGEGELTLVDVRGEDFDAHAPRFGDEVRHLVLVVQLHFQERGHVFHRVVGLEERGLHGDFGVVRGMAFVEAVAGEELDVVEDAFRHLAGDAVGNTAIDELLAVGQEFVLQLLAHRFADHVRFPGAVPGQLGGNLHDLFLVDDDAVGLGQDGFQLGMAVGDLFLPVHPGDVMGNLFHGPRAVEGDEGDDVLEFCGLHFPQDSPHALGFHLEDAGDFTGGEEFVRLRVVQGDVAQVPAFAVPLGDEVGGAAHNGEGGQAEEVDFEEAQGFEDAHVELGHGAGRALPGGTVQGGVVHQGFVRDDDPRRVGGGMSRQPFQVKGNVQQLPVLFLLVVLGLFPDGFELGDFFDGVLEFDFGTEGDEFGQFVHFGEGDVQGPSHVPDGRPRAHRPKGDDLGHVVLAVLVHRVLDHFLPTVVGEVQVDVGHGDALRVEEALEDEVVTQGVDGGDTQAVGDDGSRAGSPHVPPDIPLLGVLHQIPDDEEVGVEAHLVDDVQLMFQTPPHFRVVGPIPVAAAQADLAEVPEVGFGGVAFGDGEVG